MIFCNCRPVQPVPTRSPGAHDPLPDRGGCHAASPFSDFLARRMGMRLRSPTRDRARTGISEWRTPMAISILTSCSYVSPGDIISSGGCLASGSCHNGFDLHCVCFTLIGCNVCFGVPDMSSHGKTRPLDMCNVFKPPHGSSPNVRRPG